MLQKYFLKPFRIYLTLFFFIAPSHVFGQEEDDDEDAPESLPGIIAEYTDSSGNSFKRIDERISWKWDQSKPDPRLSGDRFQANWTGLLETSVTGEYQFHFHVQGKFNLKINGQSVLKQSSDKPAWVSSSPIKLNWGEQKIEVTFQKTNNNAQVAMFWEGPDFELEPVASHWLTHAAEETPPNHFNRGKLLVRALRCSACHQVSMKNSPIHAPDLLNLKGNIKEEWMIHWLTKKPEEDPESEDELISRRMPHYSLSTKEAEAVTAYLLSQSSPSTIKHKTLKGNQKKGQHQFLTRGCISCHRVDELGTSGLFGGGDLTNISDKRPVHFFKEWLLHPENINVHHRMPKFKLDKNDIDNIPAYLATLTENEDEQSKISKTDSADKISLGRKIVEQKKCANCHQLKDIKADSSLKTLLSSKSIWKTGCSGNDDAEKKHPLFSLSPEQQKAIQVFISESEQATISPSHKPDGHFLMKEKNCVGCHSRGNELGISGMLLDILEEDYSLAHSLGYLKPPALDSVGDKLHHKALKNAILSKRKKRRPWLYVRMPEFNLTEEESSAINEYLISADRIPPVPKNIPSISKSKLEVVGNRLVTSDGFGCTSCHQIGKLKVKHAHPGVLGPDLSMLGNDIRESWFYRWLRNPIRISPRMEMPAIKTPIRGVLDGNIHQQTKAVWNVLNEPGFTPAQANAIRVLRLRNDPENRHQAEILIDNLEINQGKQKFVFVKPLLMAFPNRHNVLFDLEKHRLTSWTLGDAAYQRTRHKYWFWESAGAPVLTVIPGNKQNETILIKNNQQFQPAIDPDFPPEFEYVQKTAKGIEFYVHLPFKGISNSSSQSVLKVTQLFEPFQSEKKSGFERTIQFENIPVKTSVLFNPLPGHDITINENRKSISIEHIKVTLLSEGLTFSNKDNGQILIKSSQKKTAVIKLKYSTELPNDQYLKPKPDTWQMAQEELTVIPGFRATRLPLPEEITPTALSWKEDGRLIFATLKGRLWEAVDTNHDEIEDKLKLLQDGFSAPFGLNSTRNEKGEPVIDIADKTALLRLTDTNKDGIPDRTETVASGWGHNLDYHGWILGLPQDEQGNYYASVTNRNGPLKHLRGRVMKLIKQKPDDPDSSRRFHMKPIAIGFRFPVGIARNKNGELFVTDNQGQYNPFNEINYIQEGNHYGFLNLKGLEDTPEIKKMKKWGTTIGIPHPWVRSVNGICFMETPESVLRKNGRPLFGPFEGHLLGCECTTRQLVRISFEKVNGHMQGAAYPLTIKPPRGASSLLRPLVSQVNPHNGDIYIGSLHDSAWGAGRNVGELVQLRFNGNLPAGIAEMRMISNGFEIEFTHPVDKNKAIKKSNYGLASYQRIPSPAYGSPDTNHRIEKIKSIQISGDGKKVTIQLNEIRKGFVYELKLRKLITSKELFHPAEAYYSVGPLP